jgi:hypothetical protein
MPNAIDRRVHPRFRLDPGYSPMSLRTHAEGEYHRHGHVYDISEGGVCFELDHPIEPGTRVSVRIDLPQSAIRAGDIGPGRAVFVTGNVVWCDIEEPGACRMAMTVTRYDRAGDKERLLRCLTAGRYLRAA